MPNLRGIIAIAVPAVTALLGLFWYLGRKKATYKNPPDKSDQCVPKHLMNSTNAAPVPCGKSDADSLHLQADLAKGDERLVSQDAGDASLVSQDAGDASLVSQDAEDDIFPDLADEDLFDLADEMTVIESQIIQPSLVSSSQTTFESQDKMEMLNTTKLSEPEVIEEVIGLKEATSVSCVLPSLRGSVSQNIDSIENLKKTENYNNNASSNISSLGRLQDNNCGSPHQLDIHNAAACDDSSSKSWHENIPEDLTNTALVPNGIEQLSSEQSMHNEQNYVQEIEDPIFSGNRDVSDYHSNGCRSPSNGKNSASPVLKKDKQSDSSNSCDNFSEVSNDSGTGHSDHGNISPPDEDRLFEFNIPANMCGLLIGTRGATVRDISQKSGTRIQVQNNPYNHKMKICVIEGTAMGIETACSIIKAKFPKLNFPSPDMAPAPKNPVLIPEIMQLALPEGITVDVIVSSIVDAGRIFVQQPTHPTYPSLERLNTFMSTCYMQEGAVPDIPRPIESGVICAAPMFNGWYRAQIMSTYEATDECDIKYVDYGGYSRVSCSLLKQIRSDFMTLPFEAVECYMANITPLENEAFYSPEAAVVLEELTQGKLLQVQVVGRAEDGVPFVHIYQLLANPMMTTVMVNREMVNRGVVRWSDS